MAGRTKGTTKEVMASRKVLEGLVNLKEAFLTEDIINALEVMRAGMNDDKATPAGRQKCAKELINLYFQLHKDSLEVVAEFESSVKERKIASEEQETKEQAPSNGVLKFSLPRT